MKSIAILSIIICLSLLTACKKDHTPDCEKNNYGTLRVTFNNPTVGHQIIVGTRSKIIAAGKLEDTMHVTAGSWVVSINDGTNNTLTVTDFKQCEEVSMSPGF